MSVLEPLVVVSATATATAPVAYALKVMVRRRGRVLAGTILRSRLEPYTPGKVEQKQAA